MNSNMRYYSLYVFSIILVVIQLSGCGGDKSPEPSRQDEVTAILTSGLWKVKSVMVDGVDRTNVYKDLTLSFTNQNFTSTNGLPVWPENGTWILVDDDAKFFIRNDQLEVTIDEATTSSLQLGLVWASSTIDTGRKTSVAGKHVFSFVK